MRSLLVSLAVALLGAAITACDHAGRGATAPSRAASTATATAVGPGVAPSMSAYEAPTHLRGLRGDGDRDSPSWGDGYLSPDDDNDRNLDHQPGDAHEGYRDADDLDSLTVGHPANAAETKTIEDLVRRYYAVAAAGNGAKACSMMARGLAKAAPRDYGKFGAPYLHGVNTCAQVTSLQFEHSRSQITPAVQFTAVHVENESRAYALFGSRTTPASYIAVVREDGSWKIGALIGGPLP